MRYHLDLPRKSRLALLAEAVAGKPKRLVQALAIAPLAAILGSLLVQWARSEQEIAAAGSLALVVAVLAAAFARRCLRPVDDAPVTS